MDLRTPLTTAIDIVRPPAKHFVQPYPQLGPRRRFLRVVVLLGGAGEPANGPAIRGIRTALSGNHPHRNLGPLSGPRARPTPSSSESACADRTSAAHGRPILMMTAWDALED